MVHKAEGSFLKQHLDDTKQTICRGEVIHPQLYPGKYSPASSSLSVFTLTVL